MPSRSPRRPGPLPNASSRRRRGAAEPPSGLFPSRDDLLRLLAVLAIAAAAAAACSRLNRRPQPFCDSVQSPDDYADDSCQPCPQNGRCVDGQLECVQGFKRYGGSCIEDGLLSQTATKIVLHLPSLSSFLACNCELMPRLYPSSFLVLFSTNQVRVATAEDLRSACSCFMRPARQNLGLFTPQISSIYKITGCYIPIFCCNSFPEFQFQKHDVSDTVDELLSKNPSGLTEDGIELVKARVLDSAQGFFETTFTSNQAEAFKCPELVAERHMPLTCQVRQWISRNIISVASSSILVCDILEDNAVSAKIGNSDCEPWVVASWLRDHLLVPRERRNASLWKKVEELILEDSRIDQYPKVIKGESKVVYEWQAGGSLSGKIKKVQGARVESRTGVGAIKLAQEMGACVGEVREQGSCDPARRDRTKA